MEGRAGMQKEAQTELKDAARNNQRGRGEHPTGQEGRQDRSAKTHPGSTSKPNRVGKSTGTDFFLKCFVVVLVLLHWQGKTHTAVLGNFRAQKSGKWVGLCLHGHDRKKATTSLYDTSAGYLNPMGQ